MKIYIPTCGRASRQTTWEGLPPQLKEITKLVVQKREAKEYKAYPTVVLPNHIRNIADTRQWLLHYHYDNENVIEMDDDLVFYKRRSLQPDKFRSASHEDMIDMVTQINTLIDHHYLVGVSAREGANRKYEPLLYATRQMRVHGFNPAALHILEVDWGTPPIAEDFYLTLSLLTKGHQNVVINDMCHNQRGSNTEGGCSTYRDLEYHEKCVTALHHAFPDYVTLVKKKTKTAWGGEERTDVRIQWKAAYRDSGRVI